MAVGKPCQELCSIILWNTPMRILLTGLFFAHLLMQRLQELVEKFLPHRVQIKWTGQREITSPASLTWLLVKDGLGVLSNTTWRQRCTQELTKSRPTLCLLLLLFAIWRVNHISSLQSIMQCRGLIQPNMWPVPMTCKGPFKRLEKNVGSIRPALRGRQRSS